MGIGIFRLRKGQVDHESTLLCFGLLSHCCEWSPKTGPKTKPKSRSKPKTRSKGKESNGNHIQWWATGTHRTFTDENGNRKFRNGLWNGKFFWWVTTTNMTTVYLHRHQSV